MPAQADIRYRHRHQVRHQPAWPVPKKHFGVSSVLRRVSPPLSRADYQTAGLARSYPSRGGYPLSILATRSTTQFVGCALWSCFWGSFSWGTPRPSPNRNSFWTGRCRGSPSLDWIVFRNRRCSTTSVRGWARPTSPPHRGATSRDWRVWRFLEHRHRGDSSGGQCRRPDVLLQGADACPNASSATEY